MPKLPRVKPTKVISALQRASFYIDHVTGSHYILILKQAGISVKEFRGYL